MTYRCLLGPSQWDAALYARGRSGDDTAPFTIPDSRYAIFVPRVNQDYSRYMPLGKFVVGNVGALPITSPLNTVNGQARYYVPTVGGVPPARVLDVTYYRSGDAFSIASDVSQYQLSGDPNMAVLQISPDARLARDALFNELEKFSIGYWEEGRDATGLFIDISPVPRTSGAPILVSYAGMHVATPLGDGAGSVAYPSIPDDLSFPFGDLLYAVLLNSEAEGLAKLGSYQAGLIREANSAGDIRMLAETIKWDALNALGAATPSIAVSR